MSSLSEASFHDWGVDEMIIWLNQEGLRDCIKPFTSKRINGLSFLNLSEYDIKTFQISQESKRKLTKILKRIKGKKRHVRKSFEDEPREPKIPSAIPAHDDHHDEGDEGWGSDFASEDEDDDEWDSDSGSGGEYIEPESQDGEFHHQESYNKEVPNVPLGLVAQLRAGLNGTMCRKPLNSPDSGLSPTQTAQVDDEIYDLPPEEDEVYEEPSDDSGSGIVVRPMSKSKLIRCPSDPPGGYIDTRRSTCSDDDTGPSPPPPARPPKPGSKAIKPPLVRHAPPPKEPEIYEEVQEEEQPGCSQVIEEYEPYPHNDEKPGNANVVEVYEPLSGPEEETYEMADNESQDTYEVPEPEAEPETYEIPEPEPVKPARPPPRAKGWNPLKTTKATDKAKPKPVKQKPAKPIPAPCKPQISPKPNPQKATPVNSSSEQQPRVSRLYPNLGGSLKEPAKKPLFNVSQQSSQLSPPSKTESEKINATTSSPRIPPLRRPPSISAADDPPPTPPRPGGSKPPPKPVRLSDSSKPGESTRGLPPLPMQPKSPVDLLKTSPWFHGPLDKKIAEASLKSFSKDGAFIVRNSSRDTSNYSMSLYLQGSVRHLSIPRTNDKFVLGASGKMQFSTIVELVDYYSQHKVDLQKGGSTTLTAACPKK